ncbi:zinc finger protein 99-like [Diprion similis]|uniref:zinc finger protein 99-like n=1 Tax=Diprion similis TaxID=362088 RepID=UPI001EF88E42|nr:zinc finger protein 99-like [Diprion similis]
MDENNVEVLSVSSKKYCDLKMPRSKAKLGHKRRRSLTPMRPVAIAPKTNFPRGVQNVDLSQSLVVKNEPGYITIVPRVSQTALENDSNKSVSVIDQYEILDSLSGPQNPKRMKVSGTEDVVTQLVIVPNQPLDAYNTILITDTDDKILRKRKMNPHEYTILKNDLSNHCILQQCNFTTDKSNTINCTFSVSPKFDFVHQEQISVSQTDEKTHSNNVYKTIPTKSKSSSHSSNASNSDSSKSNECKLSIYGNTMSNNEIDKSSLSNVSSIESSDSLDSLKARSQKPVVIMQQLLSPANRTNSIKGKQISAAGLSKVAPSNIESINIEMKNRSEHTSLPKSNESFYDLKTMNPNATRVNNYEHETDFLLKKEFPIISSSQVDSVLKAIDMQGTNRGIISNDAANHTKKEAGEKSLTDGHLLPYIQGAAKLSKNENTHCANTVTNCSTRFQTNRLTKRLQFEESVGNNAMTIEKLTDTLQCYKCKDCSYMSLNEAFIFEHIKKHMNESRSKEKQMLKCPGCSNTFHHEASLLSHIVHDHQVHQREAQFMVEQLISQQTLAIVNKNQKPFSEIRIAKTENEQILITEISNKFLDNEGQAQSLLVSHPTVLTSFQDIEDNSKLPKNNVVVENSELQCMQNVKNMHVAIREPIVDIQELTFLNDKKTFSNKSNVQQNQTIEVVEIKHGDGAENLNFVEPKNGQRHFEFVNFKNVKESEGYLQEDDTVDRGISDSEIELSGLPASRLDVETIRLETKSTKPKVKPKSKGRPKGSKSPSTKPQAVSVKQGYKCEIEDCGVRMLLQENIVYHQKCHVTATLPCTISYQCPECAEFKSNNWNNLAGHLWRSHIIDMELHCCDLCSYKTPSLSHLTNQHRGIHGENRPFLCDHCGKGFKTKKQRRNHRAHHRAKEKEPLKCDECQRNFTNARLLRLHQDAVHKESKPFTCNSCSYSASTRSALKLHLRRHTGEKPFSCDQCSYTTGDHNSLRRHKLKHLGLKPYSCPHCNYACIQTSTYKVHLKNKHPGLNHDLMFSCQYCSYKSIKKQNLLTHMAKHDQVLSDKFQAGSGMPIFVE